MDHHHAGAVPGADLQVDQITVSSSTRSSRRASLGRGRSTGHRVWRWGPGSHQAGRNPASRTSPTNYLRVAVGPRRLDLIRDPARQTKCGNLRQFQVAQIRQGRRISISPATTRAALAESRAASLRHVRSRDRLRRRRASERMTRPDRQASPRHGLRAPPAAVMLAAGTYAWRGGRTARP